MSSILNNYFPPIKDGDKHKLLMHRNECRDPQFEKFVEDIVKHVPTHKLMRYPNEPALYDAYSKFYNIPDINIGIGHGADEVIGRIFYLYRDKIFFIGDNEYFMAKAWADIYNIKTTRNLLEAEVVYKANPNSHNGVDNTNRISYLLGTGKIVIADEVYGWFNGRRRNSFANVATENPRLWVVDSMSKSLGLCGFRAGLCFATKENIEDFHRVRQGITSNSLACEVIPHVLEQKHEVTNHINRLHLGKTYLECKYKHEPSKGAYSLLKLSELPQEFKDKVYYLEGTSNARVACATKEVWESIGV